MSYANSLRAFVAFAAIFTLSNQVSGAETFSLQTELDPSATATVTVALEAGGLLISQEEGKTRSQPLQVNAQLAYRERLVHWSPDSKSLARSVRIYDSAEANIQYAQEVLEPKVSAARGPIVAEVRGGRLAVNSLGKPLSRREFDLLNTSGDSLTLDRLLPGREVAEGENWDHTAETIAPLLGMDHVALCEVSSVVVGESHSQVQIRLAGTVHGTIDGAPTEIELRGAYLFHQDRKRITKFNLAIKENRSASEVVPGLDTVAKIRITVSPTDSQHLLGKRLVSQAGNLSQPISRALLFEEPQREFRLMHDSAWYITGQQSDLLSFRYLKEGRLTAHCNVSSSTARSAGRETSLEQFEREVRDSLGDNLKSVSQSRQWTTTQGNSCLGVVSDGSIDGVDMQWRYYLVSAPDKPRVSLAVTIEKSLVETFDDADRQLVDSLELGHCGRSAPRQLEERARVANANRSWRRVVAA